MRKSDSKRTKRAKDETRRRRNIRKEKELRNGW
jgi:hypothetical protein